MFFLIKILCLASALVAAYTLMSNALPAGPLDALPLAARGFMALAVLVLGILAFTAGGRIMPGPVAACRRTRNRIDQAATAGVRLVILAAFLWLLGAAPRAVERVGLAAEPWLRPAVAEKRAELEPAAAETTREGNWLWSDRRSRALPRQTNLRPGNRPEVFLRFDTPEDAAVVLESQAYLSAFALSKYERGRWTVPNASPEPPPVIREKTTSFTTPDSRTRFPLVSHEVFHGASAAGQNLLTALQGVESVELTSLDPAADGFTILPDPSGTGIGYRYRARSRPLTLSDLPPDTVFPVRDGTPSRLLDLPENERVSTHLATQAREIAGEIPTAGSLARLEEWLRNAYDYSLQTFNPGDLDPLENFLFAERAGHCEHFAITATFMTRALGLPSRIAYGWAGGSWYQSSSLMVFRSREAHAWTEIHLPEYGWVVMDATPPSGIDGTRARVAPADETPPDPEEEFVYDAEAIDTSRIDHAAAWLLGILGLPVLAVLRIRVRGHSTHSAYRAASSGSRGNAAEGYLDAWLAACPPHHPGETLREQIRRLDGPERPPFAERLTGYHYRVRYSRERRDPATERELERAIRKWHRNRESSGFRE